MTSDVDTASTPDEPPAEFEHALVENEDAPDECAIFPRPTGEADLGAVWIVALGDGFVSLETMR